MKRTVAIALGLLACWVVPAGAWGDKGHAMSARVAVRALPADMPGFFRNALEELAYLCSEPDRWRDRQRAPALTALTAADHWMNLENVPPGLPATRYEFVAATLARKNAAGRSLTVQDVGTAAYAIAEDAERLTVSFRLWRQAPEETPEQRRIKRQIEQNIIYVAGVLAHWITDTAQPLHSTIHTNGWNPEFPNPKGFESKGIHRRFESVYVGAQINEADFAENVGPVGPIGDWIEEADRHLRASHKFVERVYELDRTVPFGSGKETAEAKELTAARLAAGAEQLRNFWYSAWSKSQ